MTGPDGQPVNAAYFWLTGMLSSFLDNAPTYLAFFNLAGGDPAYLMTTGAHTLMAISMGAVFMGAMTYIGNAPNFMVVSIVQNRGVKMPSFFRLHGLVVRYFGSDLPGSYVALLNVSRFRIDILPAAPFIRDRSGLFLPEGKPRKRRG